MHKIQIDVSPHQLRKLRKGHRVRVKKGEGLELIVHPNTYNIVSRAFNKGKGSEIQLSAEELQANQHIAKAISPEAHNPPLQPGIKMPSTSEKVQNKPINMNTMFGQGISSKLKLADTLNHHLGTNYGYLARAGMDNAINGKLSSVMAKHGIDARYSLAPGQVSVGLVGPHSRMVGGAIEKSTVGLKGGMLHAYTPPALVSQPFSANFQFQHFLPPQYQHFNTGGHSSVIGGSGL
jgi:hypothetical protein